MLLVVVVVYVCERMQGAIVSDNVDDPLALTAKVVTSTSSGDGNLPIDTSSIGLLTIFYDVTGKKKKKKESMSITYR